MTGVFVRERRRRLSASIYTGEMGTWERGTDSNLQAQEHRKPRGAQKGQEITIPSSLQKENGLEHLDVSFGGL